MGQYPNQIEVICKCTCNCTNTHGKKRSDEVDNPNTGSHRSEISVHNTQIQVIKNVFNTSAQGNGGNGQEIEIVQNELQKTSYKPEDKDSELSKLKKDYEQKEKKYKEKCTKLEKENKDKDTEISKWKKEYGENENKYKEKCTKLEK